MSDPSTPSSAAPEAPAAGAPSAHDRMLGGVAVTRRGQPHPRGVAWRSLGIVAVVIVAIVAAVYLYWPRSQWQMEVTAVRPVGMHEEAVVYIPDQVNDKLTPAKYTLKPAKPAQTLVAVDVEFQAAQSQTEATKEFAEFQGLFPMPPLAVDKLSDDKLLVRDKIGKFDCARRLVDAKEPHALLITAMAYLVLPDQTVLAPVWTVGHQPLAPTEGVMTVTRNGISYGGSATADKKMMVVRAPRVTFALVPPGQKRQVTLLFDVPKDATKGTLFFGDAEPANVLLKK